MTATFFRLDGTSFPYTLKVLPGEALSHVVPHQITLAGQHHGTYKFTPSNSDTPVYTEIEQE